MREYDIGNDAMSCELLRDLLLGSVNPGGHGPDTNIVLDDLTGK
jgi:hypothetical protein